MVADGRIHKISRMESFDVIDLGTPRPPRPPLTRKVPEPRPSSTHRRRIGVKRHRVPSLNIFEKRMTVPRFEEKFEVDERGALVPRRKPTTRRHPALYTPNPRLYSGVQPKQPKAVRRKKRPSPPVRAGGASGARARGQRHPPHTAAPNPRLYRPPAAPRRPVAPPQPTRCWSPPPARGPQATASQIALNLSQRNFIPFREILGTQPATPTSQIQKIGRRSARVKRAVLPAKGNSLAKQRGSDLSRLVLTVPSDESPEPYVTLTAQPYTSQPATQTYTYQERRVYQPLSEHFRSRCLDTESEKEGAPPPPLAPPHTTNRPSATDKKNPLMALTPQSSVTPEEGSDGNDSQSSAPSEYLAEFLSAIMGRKYPEALKYCRLILQYEPHNATARGFYPLLKHKAEHPRSPAVSSMKPPYEGKPVLGGSSTSESSSSGAGAEGVDAEVDLAVDQSHDQSDNQSDDEYADSCASLSLDDDESKSSRSASPAARGKSSTSEGSAAEYAEADLTGAGACWLADDNGNLPPHSRTHRHVDDDVENENAASGDHTLLLNEPSLRELRAQFACSIK